MPKIILRHQLNDVRIKVDSSAQGFVASIIFDNSGPHITDIPQMACIWVDTDYPNTLFFKESPYIEEHCENFIRQSISGVYMYHLPPILPGGLLPEEYACRLSRKINSFHLPIPEWLFKGLVEAMKDPALPKPEPNIDLEKPVAAPAPVNSADEDDHPPVPDVDWKEVAKKQIATKKKPQPISPDVLSALSPKKQREMGYAPKAKVKARPSPAPLKGKPTPPPKLMGTEQTVKKKVMKAANKDERDDLAVLCTIVGENFDVSPTDIMRGTKPSVRNARLSVVSIASNDMDITMEGMVKFLGMNDDQVGLALDDFQTCVAMKARFMKMHDKSEQQWLERKQ